MPDPDEEVGILVCWRVADARDPKPGAVRGVYCTLCLAEVWADPENLRHGLFVLCRPCGFRFAEDKRRGGALVTILTPAEIPGKSYTCPTCGRTSHNKHDVAARYCGACHRFDP